MKKLWIFFFISIVMFVKAEETFSIRDCSELLTPVKFEKDCVACFSSTSELSTIQLARNLTDQIHRLNPTFNLLLESTKKYQRHLEGQRDYYADLLNLKKSSEEYNLLFHKTAQNVQVIGNLDGLIEAYIERLPKSATGYACSEQPKCPEPSLKGSWADQPMYKQAMKELHDLFILRNVFETMEPLARYPSLSAEVAEHKLRFRNKYCQKVTKDNLIMPTTLPALSQKAQLALLTSESLNTPQFATRLQNALNEGITNIKIQMRDEWIPFEKEIEMELNQDYDSRFEKFVAKHSDKILELRDTKSIEHSSYGSCRIENGLGKAERTKKRKKIARDTATIVMTGIGAAVGGPLGGGLILGASAINIANRVDELKQKEQFCEREKALFLTNKQSYSKFVECSESYSSDVKKAIMLSVIDIGFTPVYLKGAPVASYMDEIIVQGMKSMTREKAITFGRTIIGLEATLLAQKKLGK